MPRLHPAGHQVIPRALRGALHQHGGLDLAEVIFAEIVAHKLADFAAHHQGLVHAGAAQVQVAVFQAQLVLHLYLVPNFKGRGLRARQHPQLGHIQLHRAGGDLVGLGVALAQQALGNGHVFAFQRPRLAEHLRVGGIVEHQLQNAGGIAQIGKNDTALVAAFGDGPRHHHLLARIGQAHFAAIMGAAQVAHAFHAISFLFAYSPRVSPGAFSRRAGAVSFSISSHIIATFAPEYKAGAEKAALYRAA